MSFTILFNSSTDLPQKVADELNLKLVPLRFTIEGETYANYLDHREYDIKEFYHKLRTGSLETTTQINV